MEIDLRYDRGKSLLERITEDFKVEPEEFFSGSELSDWKRRAYSLRSGLSEGERAAHQSTRSFHRRPSMPIGRS